MVVALVAVFGSNAWAERIAILSFKTLGEQLPDQARGPMRSSLSGGLASAGFEVVADEEVARQLSKASGLAGCETSACMRRLGELVGAAYVVKASVEVVGNARYVITLQVVSTADGQEIARVDDVCEVCTLVEANDSLSNAAAALKAKLRPKAIVGGTVAGAAPSTLVETPPPARKPNWALRGAGLGLLGVGVIGFIIGFAELAVDGNPDCTARPPAIQCPERIDSSAGQAFGFVIGSLGVAAGTVLTVLGWRPTQSTRLSIAPILSPSTAAMQLRLSF
jgi:hypothetical protein